MKAETAEVFTGYKEHQKNRKPFSRTNTRKTLKSKDVPKQLDSRELLETVVSSAVTESEQCQASREGTWAKVETLKEKTPVQKQSVQFLKRGDGSSLLLASTQARKAEQLRTESQKQRTDTNVSSSAQNDVPPEGWRVYLRKHKPSPSELADRLLRLHNQGKHEEVIRGIRAALLEGYSEPWMYEVLALSLEIAGHPRKEVERALTSRVDLATLDVPGILFTAAYLARFGANKRALELYRQAARIAPARPEPYALGLKLAERVKDSEAVLWAACGIVEHVWTSDYQKWHKMAEVAVEQLVERLRTQGQTKQAQEALKKFRAANQCDLWVQLRWVGNADLDLEVEEPKGTVCSVQNPRTPSGGIFVKDGYGPDPKNSVEEYVCPVAFSGEYKLHIKWEDGNVVGKRCVVTVICHKGTAQQTTQTKHVLLDSNDKVVRVFLKNGRRKHPESVGWTPWPIKRTTRFISEDIASSKKQSLGRLLPNGPRRLTTAQRESLRRFREAHPVRSNSPRASAVGYQPVLSILFDGASVGASAVISADRRYVRIGIAPMFSTLVDVATFSLVRHVTNGAVSSRPRPVTKPQNARPLSTQQRP